MVDGEGNIYVIYGLITLNPPGEKYPDYLYPDSIQNNYYTNSSIEPTIDKNGNIYIGFKGVASFDHNRNFRWAKNIPLASYHSLVSDKDNRIYFLTLDNKLTCIDDKGTELWQVQLDGKYYYSPVLSDGRMFFGTVHGTKRYFYSIK